MVAPLAVVELAPWIALTAFVVAALVVDLRFFARDREPRFREAAAWSVGWLVLSLLATFVVLATDGDEAAVNYVTVYLIERSLSLDNLFVFLLLFAYFAVPVADRATLLFWGIVAALAMRGVAILAGTALIERFDFVIYILGASLLVLAWRMLRGGVDEDIDPDRTLIVRAVRRFFPVTSGLRGRHWVVREDGRLHITPIALAFVMIMVTDVAFAVDSIPAAFAITTDAFVIWMANAFALLGLRALFVLVEGLIRRIRYLDETIAVVLAIVAVKLLGQDLVHVGPVASLAVVAGAFAVGITASLAADRREAAAGEPPAA